MLESVFRYQFDLHVSGATELNAVGCFFLSLGEMEAAQDPPPELLVRFAGHTPSVEPVSAAEKHGHGIRHKSGGRAIVLRLTAIRWIDDDTVEVDGGYWEGPLSSSGNTYRAERRDNEWVVVSNKIRWIS